MARAGELSLVEAACVTSVTWTNMSSCGYLGSCVLMAEVSVVASNVGTALTALCSGLAGVSGDSVLSLYSVTASSGGGEVRHGGICTCGDEVSCCVGSVFTVSSPKEGSVSNNGIV